METTIDKAKKIVAPVLITEDARTQILEACDRDGLYETFMHLLDVLVLMHPYQLCSAATGMGLGKYLPKHMETMFNDMLKAGCGKIFFIKFIRLLTGLNLRESKALAESYEALSIHNFSSENTAAAWAYYESAQNMKLLMKEKSLASSGL